MKCLYIRQTYITLDNTPNKISKNIFIFLATIRNTLKKNPKNSSLKTPPQVNKKGKRLFTQFNNRLTLYYIDVNLHLYNIKVRDQCYVKAIEVEHL